MELHELMERIRRTRQHDPLVPLIVRCANGLNLAIFPYARRSHVVDVEPSEDCTALPRGGVVRYNVPVEIVIDSINRNGGVAGKTCVGALDVS